jgi:hypothetical protein
MARVSLGIWAFALILSAACTPDSSDGNDTLPATPDAGGRAPTTMDASITSPSLPPGPVLPGVDAAAPTDAGTGSSGGGAAADGGSSAPPVSPVSIKGTAATAGCYTYTAASGDKCAGIYCGVTEAQLAAAIVTPRVGRCPNTTAAMVCKGLVVKQVGLCARRERTNDPVASNEILRPRIQACVYENKEIDPAVTTPDCLGCSLDSAQCSGDNCLIECLTGDSPQCDMCRQRAGCNDPVPGCTGLPDPR